MPERTVPTFMMELEPTPDSHHEFGPQPERRQKAMAPYLWVAVGSALGGLSRYALTRLMLPLTAAFPWSTLSINILGSFIIGFFGTLTLQAGRYPVSENARLFVMVGLCGGFTTFSSFSLQTFDLLRSGGPWSGVTRALLNVVLSVILCVCAVAAGHYLAQRNATNIAVAQTSEEELSS